MQTTEDNLWDLKQLEDALSVVIGSILQRPDRVVGTMIGVAASKLVATGIVAGAFGAVGTFGVASTGTAIASLTGAAATSATLYWIGSTIGLGVAAGGAILTVGGLAAGVPSALYVRKKVFGRPQDEAALSPAEQALLYAALRMASAARTVRVSGGVPTNEEKWLVAKQGISPLAEGIRTTYFDLAQERTECVTRPASLAVWPRRRLRSALVKLDHLNNVWSREV